MITIAHESLTLGLTSSGVDLFLKGLKLLGGGVDAALNLQFGLAFFMR